MNTFLTLLILAAFLFSLGLIAVLSRKSTIGIFLGIELMLNAAGLNFVCLSRFIIGDLSGQIMTLFIIIVAVANLAVGLAILLQYYHVKNTIDVDDIKELKA